MKLSVEDQDLIKYTVDRIIVSDETIERFKVNLKIATDSLQVSEKLKPSKIKEILAIFNNGGFYSIFSIFMFQILNQNILGIGLIILINSIIHVFGDDFTKWERTHYSFYLLQEESKEVLKKCGVYLDGNNVL